MSGENSREASRFNKKIEKLMAEFPEKVGLIHRKIALTGLEKVIMKSPVDEGRFRGNWTVSLGSPSSQYDKAKTDKSGGQTISEGSQKIADIKPYSISFISNNLPYANRIENGWSGQAPSGVLKVSFDEIKRMVK